MWMGVLWTEEGQDPVLLAYEPHRIFVLGGPLSGLAQAAVMLRAAATDAGPGSCGLPRCAHCGADLGMPDLDDTYEEGSACASS
jgi:hypothetical protein